MNQDNNLTPSHDLGQRSYYQRSKTRIMLVDDHPIVRYGICQIIHSDPGMEVIGEADGASEAIGLMRSLAPDFAIVDISLKGTNGIEVVKMLLAQSRNLPILILSMHHESVYAQRALRAGARGYVMKMEAVETLLPAIRKILDGQIFLSEQISSQLLDNALKPSLGSSRVGIDSLTDRELEVYELLGEGYSRGLIAEMMNVSIKTIETYKENLKKKLNLGGSQALLKSAIHWQNPERERERSNTAVTPEGPRKSNSILP